MLRRRGLVIFAVAFLAAAAAVAISATQPKRYSTEAAVRVQPFSEQLGLAGLSPTQTETPVQATETVAQTALRQEVLDRTRRTLRLRDSDARLRSRLSISTDIASNLVLFRAQAGSAESAARLANGVADAVAATTNDQLRRRFSDASAALRKQADELIRQLPANLASLTRKERTAFRNTRALIQTLAGNAARLDTLSVVARRAAVVRRANPPASPYFPHLVLIWVVGAIAGLGIGVIVAALLEALDQRLRRPEDVAQLVPGTVAGALPRKSLGRPPAEAGGSGAYGMLLANLRILGGSEPPGAIAVTSPLPEEGKTTVSLGLALAAVAGGARTLLLEADVHRPVHAERLGLHAAPGLVDHLRDGLALEDVVQSWDGLDCIVGGRLQSVSSDALGSRRFARLVAELRDTYDLVVIDTAPVLAVPETLQLIPVADVVAFCLRLGRTTRDQARAGVEALERLPDEVIGLVLSEVRDPIRAAGAVVAPPPEQREPARV